MGQEAALKLQKQLLDNSHFDPELLLDETGMIETVGDDPVENPEMPICILLKKRIPQDLINAVRPIVRKAATQRKVAGGARGVAAGTGMVKRRNRDGSLGTVSGAQRLEDLSEEHYVNLRSATDGTFGFLGRGTRGGLDQACRRTAYSGVRGGEWRLMAELAEAVAGVFKESLVKDRWEAQSAKAKQTSPEWLIRTKQGHTPFTTVTCNKSFRTAAHIDKGDLKAGFGVLCCFGEFEGCDLVFPRYRAAVRFREGDVLLADVHQVHGNTPLLNPDGSVPRVGREPERLTCVFYYQEKIDQCETTQEAEEEAFNRRQAKKAKSAKA
jgi:hypothetical protein